MLKQSPELKPVAGRLTDQAEPLKRYRAGTPAYLPVRPLIYGLDDSPRITLVREAPSRFKRMLIRGDLDAAVLPTVDLPVFAEHVTVLPAGCVAASGSTLLAKIFSQVRPEEISTLWADTQSSSIVVLVQLLWRCLYRRRLSIIPFDSGSDRLPDDAQAALVIGDRVVADPPIYFDRHIDPVAMWYEMTGLPFVFGLWVALRQSECEALYRLLRAARLKGRRHLAQIAARYAPAYGWPLDLALRCLTEQLEFEFTEDHREGLEEFLELAAEADLIGEVHPLRYFRP